MDFIVVVDKDMAIGQDGGLLFHLPEDLAFFKKTTMGHPVVLGRKTLATFPGGRPLVGRPHYILSRDPDFEVEGAEILGSFGELAQLLEQEKPEEKIFLIGGAELYEELLPYCHGGYITFLEAIAEEADAHFPDVRALDHWEDQGVVARSTEASTIPFTVHYFINRRPRKLEVSHG